MQFEQTVQAWTGRSGRVGLTESLKGLRRSFCDDLVIADDDHIPASWQASYSRTCALKHPGFCTSTVLLESSFWEDHAALCKFLQPAPLATLFELVAEHWDDSTDQVVRHSAYFVMADNAHVDRITLARCNKVGESMQIAHIAEKGIDFLVSHTALMEAWTACGSRCPSGLRLLRFKSLSEDDGTSIQALGDVVSGLPLVLTVMHQYTVLPAAARTALPGDTHSKVMFSPAYRHMDSLMRSLHPNPIWKKDSELDADEHFDDEAIRHMETSFARAAALNKTIRAKKMKRSLRTQMVKRRSKKAKVVPQAPSAEGQVVPEDHQARVRRAADDNI